MAWRSPSDINATLGMTEVSNYLNDVSLNWFGNMLVIAIFIIFIFGYMRVKGDDDIIEAVALSSYITFILSLLLWILGMVSGMTFGLVIGITIVSSIMLFVDKKR